MSSSTMRSGGRGGAGNFVSLKDVDAAEKARRDNDPEAQQSSSSPPPPQQQQQSAARQVAAPQYVRTGRGGAGNFAEPPTAAESRDRQDVVERTRAAVGASHAGLPRAGLSGRGGVGNWTEDGGGGGGDAGEEGEEEQARQQQIADQVAQDIGASLAPPPKTYHQHDRDME